MIRRGEFQKTSNIAKTFHSRISNALSSIDDWVYSVDHKPLDYDKGEDEVVTHEAPFNSEGYTVGLTQIVGFEGLDASATEIESAWDSINLSTEIDFGSRDGTLPEKYVAVSCSIGPDGKVSEILEYQIPDNHELNSELNKIQEGMHYTRLLDILVRIYARSPVVIESR